MNYKEQLENFKGDKRSKEYKELKRKAVAKEIGIGDVVEKITKATGIKKAVEWLANGKDCGCDKRKEKLNELDIKFRLDPNCMVESEYNWFTKYLERHQDNHYTKPDVYELVRFYARVFRIRPKVCANCNGGVKSMQNIVSDLKIIYSTYE